MSRAARSSLSLMASSVGSGLLTFLLWTVVARLEGPEVMGTVSALISTITFLAGVASLDLINVFARFVPVAGHRTLRFLLIGYAAVTGTSIVAAVILLLTPWGSRLTGTTVNPFAFVVLVALTTMYLVQGGALIGLGRAGVVAVGNISIGVLRVAALPVILLMVSGAAGVLWSWGLATVLGVVAVNAFVFLRLAPRESADPDLPSRVALGRLAAVQSANNAISATLIWFLPAIVTLVLGARDGGFFYVPWLVANTMTLLVTQVLISAVREAVAHPASASDVFRSQFKLGGAIAALAILACSVVPHVPLLILGADFADNASWLLRWIGLSIPGTALGMMFWALCLVRQRPWPMFAYNVATVGATVGGVLLLGPTGLDAGLSLSGVGLLYCTVQWVSGLAVVPLLIGSVRQVLGRGRQSRPAVPTS